MPADLMVVPFAAASDSGGAIPTIDVLRFKISSAGYQKQHLGIQSYAFRFWIPLGTNPPSNSGTVWLSQNAGKT